MSKRNEILEKFFEDSVGSKKSAPDAETEVNILFESVGVLGFVAFITKSF